MVDREIDDSLEENADRVVHEIDEALRQLDDGSYGTCTACGEKIPEERLAAVPYEHCACGTSAPGARLSEPARTRAAPSVDIRVGSATNALQPISSAERSLAAGPGQWLALAIVAGTAIAADQLTKWIVSGRLGLGEAVATIGPFSIHHVQNTGIAFGLFPNSTTAVIGLTGAAVAAMVVFFAHSAQRHPVLSVSLGLVIGGSVSNLVDRVRLGHVTDSSTSTTGRRSTSQTRSSSSASDSSSPRSLRPTGRAHALAPLRFRVSDAQAGVRLDRVLAERPEISSRALAERLIADGAALVDGERRPKSHRLGGGESVNVDIPAVLALVPEAMDLAVLWEDEHLLVADKPAGLVVHPAGGARTGTLVHGLLELGAEGGDDDDRPGIVHRLDKDTSGLLVVARSDEAHAGLQDMIRKRELERRYLALVRGAPRSRSGGSRLQSGAIARIARAIRWTRPPHATP